MIKMSVSEIKIGEIPIPLINYIYLIRDRKPPYYDIVEHLVKEMKLYYLKGEQSVFVYAINPRILQEELEQKVTNEKLTTMNICRTIQAFLYGSDLRKKKDFYVSTTSHGKKNYHIKVNQRTLNLLSTRLI